MAWYNRENPRVQKVLMKVPGRSVPILYDEMKDIIYS